MDATHWLQTAKSQFPGINFETGEDFRWSPRTQTVYIGTITCERDVVTLLHEIGHAIAGHDGYDRDIDLLKLEREAWTVAKNDIAPLFDIGIDEDLVEQALDSYRDWLHARSRCPECNQNGIQQSLHAYKCLLCNTVWRVNDARRCGLKRYRIAIENTR